MTDERGQIESISNVRINDGRLQVEARYRFNLIPESSTVTSGSDNAAAAVLTGDKNSVIDDTQQICRDEITDDEILKFLADHENKATSRKTLSDISALRSFLHLMKEFRDNYKIPPQELIKLLSKYFMVVRISDGT